MKKIQLRIVLAIIASIMSILSQTTADQEEILCSTKNRWEVKQFSTANNDKDDDTTIYGSILPRNLLVIWDSVNFRMEPEGKVVDRLEYGEVLLWIDEFHTEEELWYHTISKQHGEGYVMAKYLAPIINSESISQLANDSPLNDNLLDFYTKYYLLQIKYGFLIPDKANTNLIYSWDDSIDFDNALVELAKLLDEHCLIPLTEESYLLYKETETLYQRIDVAKRIIKEHYGTDILWDIFARSTIGGSDIQYEDWHSPIIPDSEDKVKLEMVRNAIKREYGVMDFNN